MTGLRLAIDHPDRVDRLVAASVTCDLAGTQPGFRNFIPKMTVEGFAAMPKTEDYKELAADPDGFPALEHQPMAWGDELAGIKEPVLIVAGDANDVTAEHAVQMFRLLGGGKMGDMGQPLRVFAIWMVALLNQET